MSISPFSSHPGQIFALTHLHTIVPLSSIKLILWPKPCDFMFPIPMPLPPINLWPNLHACPCHYPLLIHTHHDSCSHDTPQPSINLIPSPSPCDLSRCLNKPHPNNKPPCRQTVVNVIQYFRQCFQPAFFLLHIPVYVVCAM